MSRTRRRVELARRERDGVTRRGRWAWRLVRWTGALLLVAVFVLIGLALPYTLFPDHSAAPSDEVDAVVLFSGGSGERLEAALALMSRTDADVLYVSGGTDPRWPQANALCGERRETFAVRCFEPVPSSTRGEARAVARLAEEQRWGSVALVTSTYHVTRSRLLTSRCFDGEIEAVGAGPDATVGRMAFLSLRELAALGEATLLERDC